MERRRWVVKAGSNTVCSGGPLLVRDWMAQVADLQRHHAVDVVWVTSGAIATALDRMDCDVDRSDLSAKQALSALGQPLVMDVYNLALQRVGLNGAQVLLTAEDLEIPAHRSNLVNTLNKLIEWRAIPVLNENDATATEEIQFGDNDRLSWLVAQAIGATKLILLTDVDGFYEADPRKNPDAKLVTHLAEVTEAILAKADGAGKRGAGGMRSKLTSAREASLAGIQTWLIRGDRPRSLLDVVNGTAIGTRIEKDS